MNINHIDKILYNEVSDQNSVTNYLSIIIGPLL